MSKSTELNKKLAEVVLPMGFIKVPKKRYFVRLYGDGIFQGVTWEAQRWPPQTLDVWFESIWQDPEYTFEHIFVERYGWLMSYTINSEVFNWNGYTSSYNTDRTEYHDEDAVFDHFLKYYIFLLKDCDTHQKLFKIRAEASSRDPGVYNYRGLERFNISLFLNDREECQKNIDGFIDDCEFWIDANNKRYDEKDEIFRAIYKSQNKSFMEDIENARALTKYLESRDEAVKYLNACKQKNLEDFNIITKGKLSDIIEKYMEYEAH